MDLLIKLTCSVKVRFYSELLSQTFKLFGVIAIALNTKYCVKCAQFRRQTQTAKTRNTALSVHSFADKHRPLKHKIQR